MMRFEPAASTLLGGAALLLAGCTKPGVVPSDEPEPELRPLQVVVVMDVSGSFEDDIGLVADASVDLLDALSAEGQGADRIGMAVFNYRYAWEWTPLLSLADAEPVAAARTQWATLAVASKDVHGDDWATGGKYPQMPREYSDEAGTDHHVGLVMARTMLTEVWDPAAFGAVVVVTDGDPNGLNTASNRATRGYEESRWREYAGPVPHSVADIEAASVAEAVAAHDEGVHVWTVSLRARRPFLADMAQGEGVHHATEDAADVAGILDGIAADLASRRSE